MDIKIIEFGKREICMIANYIITNRGEIELSKIISENSAKPEFITRTLKHTFWALNNCNKHIHISDLLKNIEILSTFYCACTIISAEEIISKEYYDHK